MSILDRYLLRQYVWSSCSLLGVVFSMIFLAQSIRIVETVTEHSKGFPLFAELAVLLVPPILTIAIPVTGFIGVLHCLQRLHGDSEVAAVYAAGIPPARLLPAIAWFGILMAVLTGVTALYLSPSASSASQERLAELRGNLSTRFLQEGRFLNPAPNLTVFTRQIDRNDVMHDIFIHDARNPNRVTSYTANEALIEWPEGRPQLLMRHGSAYTLDQAGGQTGLLRFDQFTYYLAGLLVASDARPPKPSELYVTELLNPKAWPAEANAGLYVIEAHEQLSAPLVALALPFIALAGLLGGRVRAGTLKRRLFWSVTAGVSLFLLEFVSKSVVRSEAAMWPLFYLLPAFYLLISMMIMGRAGRTVQAAAMS